MPMRHLLMLGLAAGVGAGQVQLPAPPPPAAESLDDIVVTARRGPRPPLPEPVAYFQRLCFDPVRTKRRFEIPDRDPDWSPLEDSARAQFQIVDPDVEAYGLSDPATGRSLLLKFESLKETGGLSQLRCTLVVIGGADHAALKDRLTAMLGGPGTQRHVGHIHGVPALPNWSQWLWNGYPDRGLKRWETIKAPGAGYAAGTWVVVTAPSFWRTSDYFAVDLKTRQTGPQPLSVVTFSYVTRK